MEYKMKKPAKKMMYGGKMPYADCPKKWLINQGGKTGMRGQVKKDDMNKKLLTRLLKKLWTQNTRAKLTHQKSLIWVLQKQECLARLDLIVRKWHITAVALLLKVVQLVRCLWAAKLVVWALLPRVAHSLRTGN
jgi:hypothetical protein